METPEVLLPQEIDGRVTRRRVIVGGTTLLAATVASACTTTTPVATQVAPAASPAGATPAQVVAKQNGTKPVYLVEGAAPDPVAYSLADTLFWTDIFMEHAKFFVMLMPGPELAGPRGQAEQFQARFAQQFERAKAMRWERGGYVAFNRSTLELVKPFIDFKRRMHDEQASGRMHSLVWPLFFDHTAHEAERFTRRLSQLSTGNVELARPEVIEFWAQIMEEHADFIAHLLDPQERLLIKAAEKSSQMFNNLRNDPDAKVKALAEAQGIIAFKTTAEKGIREGKIKSIIHPSLADHVRREAVKFKDEVSRV